MYFSYSLEKDIQLRQERGISFASIIALIEAGALLDMVDYPNSERYPGQKIYVIDRDGYIWLVPYVQTGEEIFLKTAFPSRKHTRDYQSKEKGIS
jgi:hypothetical protein